MINLASQVFESEIIFLQPTWFCKKSCPACYVKEKQDKFGSEHMPEDLWSALIDDIVVYGHKIRTNQVTMALDTLSSKEDEYTLMYQIARDYMRAIRCKSFSYKGPQKHLTVNCVNDLEEYTNSELFEQLDLISVSNINSLADIKLIRERAPWAKINWNILSSSLIRKSQEQIIEILTHVNQAYLLLHKAPLGKEGHDFDSWNKALDVIDQINYKFSIGDRLDNLLDFDGPEVCPVPNPASKIVIDGCIQDAFNFRKTGEGCCSNISRFQIWPDGRVTGCAYNSHERYGKFAKSVDDVVDNLREARERYEFDRCTIPNFGLTKLGKANENKSR